MALLNLISFFIPFLTKSRLSDTKHYIAKFPIAVLIPLDQALRKTIADISFGDYMRLIAMFLI